ncbi:MAG: LapA family protein [Spirochaetia bacterium]|jgi:uncharacterized integral membrane protein|nr:LapA family protein [Spirochaetia bacterium]
MLRFIIGIVFGVFVIIFMGQNTDVTQITFLFWSVSMSRAVMYLIIFVLGFGSGGLIAGFKRSKKRKN